jgi:hypothetical protein
MWASLIAFQYGLGQLRHYISGLEKHDRLLGAKVEDCPDGSNCKILISDLQAHFKTQNSKATFEYNTIIVSLYGYVEQYVESLIGEYLTYLSDTVPSYGQLPGALQQRHLDLSLDLIKLTDHVQKYQAVKKEIVIANLHSCFGTPNSYTLNIEAYTHHGANLRQKTITEMFLQCGVAGLSHALRNHESLIKVLTDLDPDRDVSKLMQKEDAVIFWPIDDLAERRNEVSHGSPAQLLSNDILLERIAFVEAYGEALASVIYQRRLSVDAKYRSRELGMPLAVFNNCIVCVALGSGSVRIGDVLIAQTPDENYLSGKIMSIEREHVPHEVVHGGEGVQIGMRVEFAAKKNQFFFLMPQAIAPETVPDEIIENEIELAQDGSDEDDEVVATVPDAVPVLATPAEIP